MQSLETIAKYFGISKLPEIAGTKSGPLVVMCPANCVWDDIRKINLTHYSTLAVKEVSWFFTRIFGKQLDHAASFEEVFNLNFTKGMAFDVPLAAKQIHTTSEWPVEGDYIWDTTKNCGTSGLFGLMVGVLMGYAPVILAGSPLDDSPHFYEPDYVVYPEYTKQGHQTEWRKACEMFKGRAFSLSGKTQEWLGAPCGL